jgi:hypothetical protein
MCGGCSPIQKAVSKEAVVASAQSLGVPKHLALDLYAAVTEKDKGAHLGEATFFAVILTALGNYLKGEWSNNHGFGLGFLMPLSAHDSRRDASGVPQKRYETAKMRTLLDSFRRVWMSDTVREAVTAALKAHGIAIPTFACTGVAVVPFSQKEEALAWYRAGWQLLRAEVDQGDRTMGPENGLMSFEDLPTTIDLSPAQLATLRTAFETATLMSMSTTSQMQLAA